MPAEPPKMDCGLFFPPKLASPCTSRAVAKVKSGFQNSLAREAGFSLAELMLVVAVTVLVATLALPSIREISRAYRLRIAADEIMMTLESGRAQAVERNGNTQVIFDGATGTWGVDSDFNHLIEGKEQHSAPAGITLSSTVTVTFSSRGELPIGETVARIVVTNGAATKTVAVSPRGRVTLE